MIRCGYRYALCLLGLDYFEPWSLSLLFCEKCYFILSPFIVTKLIHLGQHMERNSTVLGNDLVVAYLFILRLESASQVEVSNAFSLCK